MKAYSMDLRERVVRAVERGMAKAEAARAFAVSLATVKNYVRQFHRTGSLAARPIPGRPRDIPRDQDAALVAQLRATPDATLQELVAAWQAARGAAVSVATMSRAIRRVRWTRKKRRWAPMSATR
jgi:transposase